jgi:uncharacterized Fe-S cluster protein YjdI
MKKKEYSNGEITVVWQPELCIHSGKCVKSLPEAYKPNEKPWIKIDNASTEQFKNQLATCPSGALSYYMNKEESKAPEVQETKIEVIDGGPLIVHGTVVIKDSEGGVVRKDKKTALCRCGASSNKPYCDGTHRKIDFK